MRHGPILALVLTLAWVSALPSPSGAAAVPGGASSRQLHTLVFLGDSLTAGYGLDDPQEESYPSLIRRRIEAAGLPWCVVNAGVSGDTTSGGLGRIGWILRSPVDLVVIALGANDGLRGLPVGSMRANLQAIIDRIHAVRTGAGIVLAGMRMPPNLGEAYTRSFAAVYTDLAKRNGIPLIPFLLEGVAEIPRLNQADGIHPTTEGHVRLAANVWPVLEPMLIRDAPARPAAVSVP